MEHSWQVTPAEAVVIQKSLRQEVVDRDDLGPVKLVAGVDVGFDKTSGRGRAAIAVLRLDGLELVETALAERPLEFPYVPGLLSFREIPVIMEALEQLHCQPDLLLCDGQGRAHPRRLGIASHLGVLTGRATIGVAKTRLTGSHGEVPNFKGGWTELRDGEEVIGAVLRTRKDVKPVYVSAGHRISLASSIAYVMRCVSRYKLPETTRQAHRLSLFARRGEI